MVEQKEIEKLVKKAVSYLEKRWKKQSFFSFQTPFPSILIADALKNTSKARELRSLIIKELTKEKSENSSFNYWLRDSEKFMSEPYPDDLDDTFCAWAAIRNFDQSFVNGKVLADLTAILLKLQKSDAGPYFTWIVEEDPNNNWKDLDFAVNSNIAYFLSLEEISLKALINFLEEKIKKDDYSSVFYKGEAPSIYFLSRFYQGKEKNKIKKKIESLLSKENSILELVFLLIAALNFGFFDLVTDKHLKRIINFQAEDGSYQACDFYFYQDPDDNENKSSYIKDEVITTAFVLEFLSLYQQYFLKKNNDSNLDFLLVDEERLVKKLDEKLLLVRNLELRNEISSLAKVIISKDSDGFILFLATLLAKSLNLEVNDAFLIDLALINLFAWVAYTIYDDHNDQEETKNALPVANVSWQLLCDSLLSLEVEDQVWGNFFSLSLEMETANYFELKKLRFDTLPWKNLKSLSEADFSDFLYKKSIAQFLTIDILLGKIKFDKRSEQYQKIKKFIENLIKIRQLNDDHHDWQEDLGKGQINSANYQLLKLISKKKNRDQLLKKDKGNQLAVIFWEKIAADFSIKSLALLKETKNLAKIIFLKRNVNYFKKILTNYEKIINKSISTQERALDFLEFYFDEDIVNKPRQKISQNSQ